MILIPTQCPSCNSNIERVKDQLFCRNPDCSDKLSKIVRGYASKAKIKGLGEVTIKKLGLTNIQSIYNLTEKFIIDVIGEALGTKLVREIEKAKNLDLGTFLSGCSIYLIGTTAGRKIAALTNNPEDINKELCKQAGLGEKATKSLLDWLSNEYVYMDLPIKFNDVEQAESSTEAIISVCITGRLSNYTKSKATDLLKPYGINVVNTVNKNTAYLICDAEKGSAKEKKAIQLNIEIISMKKLMEKFK